jgi:putative addiction module killer protein
VHSFANSVTAISNHGQVGRAPPPPLIQARAGNQFFPEIHLIYCIPWDTNKKMIELRKTENFLEFMDDLRDHRAKTKIAGRVDRLAFGHEGDVAPVGEGISELRIHFGPGYRVYFKRRGDVLIVILCGGDKSSQDRDIKLAKQLVKELEL